MTLAALARRLKVGHKLALALAFAALLPLAFAGFAAVRLVLGTLESGLAAQTDRQLEIGLNLLLRAIEGIGEDAAQLAALPALAEGIAEGATATQALIERDVVLRRGVGLVQILSARGDQIATRATGVDEAEARSLALTADTDVVARGLAYEQRVSVVPLNGRLVVRAVAPVTDRALALHGLVVVSVPLDEGFASRLRAALGADVLLHAGDGPGISSLTDATGARIDGLVAPAGVAARVLAGARTMARIEILGVEHQGAWAPIKDERGSFVGMLGVVVARSDVAAAKVNAARSLAIGGVAAVAFSLLLAGSLTRWLVRPLRRLHDAARAVARGEREGLPAPPSSSADEVAGLTRAFSEMTSSLRDADRRLGARMRELEALHDASSAIAEALGLAEVPRTIVDGARRVLGAEQAALYVPASDGSFEPIVSPDDAGAMATARKHEELARGVLAQKRSGAAVALRQDEPHVLAIALGRADAPAAVLIVQRRSPPLTPEDATLLGTFGDGARAALENAALVDELRAMSGDLERKVQLRTKELTSINVELGRALSELRETQGQLVHSERLAGLGALVAGVAHEINSPSAAIRGITDALGAAVERFPRGAQELLTAEPDAGRRAAWLALCDRLAPALAERRVTAPADVRRRARELTERLTAARLPEPARHAGRLAEIGADAIVDELLPALRDAASASPLIDHLVDLTYLHRSTTSIASGIRQIQRIVGALKGYSHLDQASVEPADLHEGLENTLVILHHELKYGITVVRKYGQIPKIPVYVDELNQVWTNLILNAVQALGGKGEITIETEAKGDAVEVRVIDDGPGVPADVLPRIFEPFFTTKKKGEGTGLGLGIVKKIIDKHGGTVTVDSRPGRTAFAVTLPVAGPA